MGNEASCQCQLLPFDDDLDLKRNENPGVRSRPFFCINNIPKTAQQGLDEAVKAKFDELRQQTLWGAVDLVPGFEYEIPILEPDFHFSEDSFKRFRQYVHSFEGWRACVNKLTDEERRKYKITNQNDGYFVTVKFTVPDDLASLLLDEPPLVQRQIAAANLTVDTASTSGSEAVLPNKWQEMTRDTFLDEWDNRSLEINKVRSLQHTKGFVKTFVQPTLVQPRSTPNFATLVPLNSGFKEDQLLQSRDDSFKGSVPVSLRRTPALANLTPESSLDDSTDSLGLGHPMDDDDSRQPPQLRQQQGPSVASAFAVFPAALHNNSDDDIGSKKTRWRISLMNQKNGKAKSARRPSTIEGMVTETVSYGDMNSPAVVASTQVVVDSSFGSNSLIHQSPASMDPFVACLRAHPN